MKLYEIARSKGGSSHEDLTVDTEAYGRIKLRVEYDWEAATSDRHGDDASFDEHHPGGFDVSKVTLQQDVPEQDDDGEPTEKVVKSGAKASKLKHWTDGDDKDVEKALTKLLKKRDD